jgi:hypothetical protein
VNPSAAVTGQPGDDGGVDHGAGLAAPEAPVVGELLRQRLEVLRISATSRRAVSSSGVAWRFQAFDMMFEM